MDSEIQVPADMLENATVLLSSNQDDVFSYLGLQAERLEIADIRLEEGRGVPPWSDDDARTKVFSAQRAPTHELLEYTKRGREFATSAIASARSQLRVILCKGSEVRPEITDVETDAKSLIKILAAAVAGALMVHYPDALSQGVVSVSTIVAVVTIKSGLRRFCADLVDIPK